VVSLQARPDGFARRTTPEVHPNPPDSAVSSLANVARVFKHASYAGAPSPVCCCGAQPLGMKTPNRNAVIPGFR
jgi:hypothetical protein